MDVNGECLNSACSTIEHCSDCRIILSTGEIICVDCAGDHRRVNDNNECVCQVGYYEENDECVACGDGCQVCENPTTCNECALESFDNQDGTCSCRDGTFLAVTETKLYCRPCNPNCAKCEDEAGKCSECLNGYVADNNECVCPDKTYEVAPLTQCAPCTPRCNECSSVTSCSDCEDGSIWDQNSNSCVLQCPPGTYNAGS